MNEHAKWIEKTYPGGLSAYIADQVRRYENDAKAGRDVTKYRDDAKRVGYSLPTVSPPPSTGGETGYKPVVDVDEDWVGGVVKDVGDTVAGGVKSVTSNFGYAAIVGLGAVFLVMSVTSAFRRAR